MKVLTKTLLFIAVCSAAALCSQDQTTSAVAPVWPQEPEGFQRIKFGDSPSGLLAKINTHSCYDKDRDGGCLSSTNVGSSMISLTLLFRDQKLGLISGEFSSFEFMTLKPLFLERYGTPTSDKIETVTNRLGGKFENETLTWTGKNVSLTFQRFYSSIGKGNFTLSSNIYIEEVKKEQEEKRKQDAKKM
jgi:hypothetical protein